MTAVSFWKTGRSTEYWKLCSSVVDIFTSLCWSRLRTTRALIPILGKTLSISFSVLWKYVLISFKRSLIISWRKYKRNSAPFHRKCLPRTSIIKLYTSVRSCKFTKCRHSIISRIPKLTESFARNIFGKSSN